MIKIISAQKEKLFRKAMPIIVMLQYNMMVVSTKESQGIIKDKKTAETKSLRKVPVQSV